MANPKKGRWALISDGNPDTLARFFRGCREQGIETQGVVVNCPNGDFDWPKNWGQHSGGPIAKTGDEWFGLLWSDQCPQSPKWDITLIDAVRPWNVVTSMDASQGDWRRGAVVWGTECMKTGGGLDITGLDHELSAWSVIARSAKCWHVTDVLLPRQTGPSIPAMLHAASGGDKPLRECMTRHGVRVCEPDYTGVSLLISTPSISKPAVEYTISLMRTQQELSGMCVPTEWTLERWNADICMARSHIVAEFLRTKHTHLLMIDDDMSWEPGAVHRLFWSGKDVVAVAGPKKSYPLRFAASKVDGNGRPVPIETDPETGVSEVDSVGCAFMLVSRSAIERMIDAYPELAYTGSDGKTAHALFLQQIVNDRYLPEDFSFCQRWRNIGGKVHIATDVPLGHIGQHEFKGSLLESCMKGGA